jgi:acetyl-CoA C-acetyltransferase
VIAAGNASQFSDGAGACIVMDEALASKRGLAPWAASLALRLRGGLEPDEMVWGLDFMPYPSY